MRPSTLPPQPPPPPSTSGATRGDWHKWQDGSWHAYAEGSATADSARREEKASAALLDACCRADADGVRAALDDPCIAKTAVYDMPDSCMLHHLASRADSLSFSGASAVLDEIIALLVNAGCAIDHSGEPDWTTPLGRAVVNGRCPVVCALARAGASLDCTVSKRGRSLRAAAEFYLSGQPREEMLAALAELARGAGVGGFEREAVLPEAREAMAATLAEIKRRAAAE